MLPCMETTQKNNSIWRLIPGLFLALILGFLALALDKQWPVLGAPAIALVFGLVLSFLLRQEAVKTWTTAGIDFSSKRILQTGVALMGFKLSLLQVFETGKASLVIMLASIAVSFLVAWLMGRLLKVEKRLAVLIGTGTAICGASAIAAAGPVIGAKKEDYSYSFSVIFLFNILALFLFPALGRLLGLSDYSFGVWAGTAINDTSSVVGAAYGWSDQAGDTAVVVKLTRTLMIIPVSLILGYLARKGRFGQSDETMSKKAASVPWFLLAFLVASGLRTLNFIPEAVLSVLSFLSTLFTCSALAAIGFSSNIKGIIQSGWRPLVLGVATWFGVALSSILLNTFLL